MDCSFGPLQGIASMPLELLHTALCVVFLVVWAMIGQVTVRRRH